MKTLLTFCLSATLIVGHIASAWAHGVSRVRKQLHEQGYSELEFQRRKAPFKLNACREGTRYHLHIDFYGKITKKSVAGDCDQESVDEAGFDGNDNATSSDASPDSDSDGSATESDPETASDDNSGSDNESADEDVSEEAIERCWRFVGGQACRDLEKKR